MSFSYLVFGAGRQGTAAAYDLLRFGEADRVTLADASLERAQAAVRRVTALSGQDCAGPLQLDASDPRAVQAAMRGCDVVLSAVPYYYNLALAQAAIAAGVDFCDLGGNTGIVRQQHALDELARQAGVRIIPDCGMGPGMGNTLAVYGMQLLDRADEVYLYDCGLPEKPEPPWNYQPTFNLEGLANEYTGSMTVLRDGKLADLPVFSELEMVDIPPLGQLEAFVLAGGVSTAPWTFQGRLKSYQLKVLRYPGSYAQLKAFSDLGLFRPELIQVAGTLVSPRQVFITLFEPQVRAEVVKDVCVIRVVVLGEKDGSQARAQVDLVDRYDPATGFTAMERTTGWHLAIVAGMMARGETPLGATPLETAVPGDAFVRQARLRGFEIKEKVETVNET